MDSFALLFLQFLSKMDAYSARLIRLGVIMISFSGFLRTSQSTIHINSLAARSSAFDSPYILALLRDIDRQCESSPKVANSRRECKFELNRGRRFLNVHSGGYTDQEDDSDQDEGESDDNNDGGDDEEDDGDDDDDDEQNDDSKESSEDDETTVDDEDNVSEMKDEQNGEDDEDDDDEESDDTEVPVARSKKNYGVKRKATMFETGVGSLTTAAASAFKLTKGGMKAAVDLVSSKHVTASQIVGKWRMEQEVEISKGASVTCPASLEFTEGSEVITTFEGKSLTSDLKFTERPWPRKCSIQFEAAAFQGPGDKEPVKMFYKGYFKKSIMNPNVILIRGKVYKLVGSMFWKKQKKCGSFKATQKRYR